MAGLGVEKLEKLMPEIVATASSGHCPHVRDGYIMMFNYLPITRDKFTPYVGPIIPCILKAGTGAPTEKVGPRGGGQDTCSLLGARPLSQMQLGSRESCFFLGLGA